MIAGLAMTLLTTQTFADSNASYAASTLQDYRASLIKAITDRTTKFSIDYSGNTSDITGEFKTIVSQADNPDDYLRWCISSYNASLTGTSTYSTTSFEYTYVATLEEEKAVDAKIDAILPMIVRPNMSLADTVYSIHKYITDTVSYDRTLAKHSSYNALIENSSVCQGYALLLDKMLEKSGMDSVTACVE
jgi:transglutaminase/protease-like cytokinesis protein 3